MTPRCLPVFPTFGVALSERGIYPAVREEDGLPALGSSARFPSPELGFSHGNEKRAQRSCVRPRIPLAYAGLLIIALVAVIGFAAFSPSGTDDAAEVTEVSEAPAADVQASARVASAVLALRVSNADSRTATTNASEPTTTSSAPTTSTPDTAADEPTSTSTEPSTTAAPSTTSQPSTTQTAAADTTPPSIRVTSPDDGDTVDDRVTTFKGVTEPGATVSSGPFAADVADDGTWSIALVLAPGANGASFTATDEAGNKESTRIVVNYEPAQTTTTTKAPTTTTTSASTTTTAASSKWSPQWPADAGGIRNVEAWRPLVAKHWPAELVDCALNIIKKESQGDPRAYNSYSNAEGLFQHLSKYWKSRAAAAGFKDSNGLVASPYNAEANIAAAWVIAKGSTPWHRPWTVNPYGGACQE